MDGDFAEQTDTEGSPKEVDKLKLSDDAAFTKKSEEGRSPERQGSVDFNNILDVLTVNDSEFDNLPNVAGAVSELLLPKDSFASSFAPTNKSFSSSLDGAVSESLVSDVNSSNESVRTGDATASFIANEEAKREGLRKVSLEEMMIEAGQPIFQPIPIEEPKLKRESKASKKKLKAAEIVVEQELGLPSIVGTKPGKKPPLDTGASGLRMRREDKVDLKLPAQSIPLSSKKKITRSNAKLVNSQEAEDVPVRKRSENFLPELPHTSPAETKREKKKKQKPLYLRMQEKVKKLVAEEERLKHEEYLRQKNLRAKGHYNKEEIKEHIRQHDELMKMKQTEVKHNHISQVRALRNKSRDIQDGSNSGNIDEQGSLSSLDNHKPTKSKHRKQLEDYDAVSYKVEDSSKERKRKHKKLMDMISPRQRRGSGDMDGADDDNDTSSRSHPNITEASSSTPRVDKNGNDDETTSSSVGKHNQQQVFSPFSDDIEAFNNLASASLEPRPPHGRAQQDSIIQDPDSSNKKGEKIFVDPFVHVDSNVKVAMDGSVIPTYIDTDWVTMLHNDGDNDTENLLMVL